MAFEELEKFDLEEIGLTNDFTKIHNEYIVNLNDKVPYPPVAIGIGYKEYKGRQYPIPFGTSGNFSAIVGMPKAGKTFFKSLMTACYIGGNSTQFAPNIKGYRDEKSFILDFDTEQGDWHVQATAQRTAEMVGGLYNNYKAFKLRAMNFIERIQFIEYCILEHPIYRKNLGLVIVDGYADLVADVNDLKECNLMVQKLMKWTELSQCHLTGIIHANYSKENKKATGHLGSAVTKKAETVCYLELENNQESGERITRVDFKETRSGSIEPFGFKVENNYPYVVENIQTLDF